MLAGAVSPQRMRTSTEDEVRTLSDRFYSALSHLDLPQPADIWSHKGSIITMHPMGGEQVGWPELHKAFEEAAGAMADVTSNSQTDLEPGQELL